jgi:hypothetical protein
MQSEAALVRDPRMLDIVHIAAVQVPQVQREAAGFVKQGGASH